MNQERIGAFIASLRAEKNLTQKELAGRLHPGWPSDWAQSGVELRWNVWAWPVVAQFPKGVLLKAAPDVAGQIIIKDENNDSWLRVYLDESEGSVCFVRCNKRFLRPYKTNTPPANLPTLPEPEPEPLPVEPSPSPSPSTAASSTLCDRGRARASVRVASSASLRASGVPGASPRKSTPPGRGRAPGPEQGVNRV